MRVKETVLRDFVNVVCIGLPKKDILVIQSTIKLFAHTHNNPIQILDSSEINSADIVLINTDVDHSVEVVHKLESKKTCVVVSLYAKGGAPLKGYKSLALPVTARQIADLFISIISTNESSDLSPLSNSDVQSSRKRILIVDDSFPVRQYMQDKIPELSEWIESGEGFDLEFASSGREAVDKIRKRRGQYQAVFLDVIMGDVDGYNVCKWIKKCSKTIKVIMLTSRASPIDKIKGNLAGSDYYLTKPPRDKELVRVLSRI